MANTYTTANTVLNNNLATGQVLTSAGSNGTSYTTSWTNPNSNFHDGNEAVMVIPHGSKTVEITKSATLDVKGTVMINGVDLEERLNTIEKVLQIPERDVILEAKHPKLKKMYDEYIQALGKYRTWQAIKGEE